MCLAGERLWWYNYKNNVFYKKTAFAWKYPKQFMGTFFVDHRLFLAYRGLESGIGGAIYHGQSISVAGSL